MIISNAVRSHSSLSAPRWPSHWGAVLRWLTEPALALPEPERRRARVLTWLLLTLILLVIVALCLVLIFDGAMDARRGLYTSLLMGLLGILLCAFGLNHAGRYATAAHLIVTCAILGPWGSIVLDRKILNGDFVPLTYIVLSVLLCSILLSVRVTLVLAAIQFVALLALPIFTSATSVINWPSLLVFIVFTSILGVVSNFIGRKDLEQIERQTRQLVESEARLRELSVRDALTGLFNRRYLEETLERELQRAARDRCPVGIIMVDLDYFKRFNDTYGHAAGDALLRQLGLSMGRRVRGSDIACRYGGEEFTFVLPEASREVTRARAELLCEDARRLRVRYEGQTLNVVTLSLGVASFPEHGFTGAEVLRAADAALYRAKREGRDRVVLADRRQEPPENEPRYPLPEGKG